MNALETVQARMAEIEAELRTMNAGAESRSFTEEETTRWESLLAEYEERKADEVRIQAEEARAAKIAAERAKWGSLQVGTTVSTEDVDIRTLPLDLNFWFGWGIGGEGDDIPFCRRVRELGYSMAVDTDVELGHISAMPLTPDDWRANRGKAGV